MGFFKRAVNLLSGAVSLSTRNSSALDEEKESALAADLARPRKKFSSVSNTARSEGESLKAPVSESKPLQKEEPELPLPPKKRTL